MGREKSPGEILKAEIANLEAQLRSKRSQFAALKERCNHEYDHDQTFGGGRCVSEVCKNCQKDLVKK